MKVEVLGKSKVVSQEKNNFTVAHVVAPFRNGFGEGQRVEQVYLPVEQFPYDKVMINAVYELDRDSRGFIIGFDYIESL